MTRYAWSVPVMFVAGLAIGRFAFEASWVVAVIDGVVLSALFNGAFWFAGGRRRNEQ
jgi:hypothetical protein